MKTEKSSDDNVLVRIQAIDTHGSTADGGGIRSVVFFQGCSRHCPGCHNPETWNPCGGFAMTVGEVVSRLKRAGLRKVTISGGEPLEQPMALRALLRRLNDERFDIALYTGGARTEVPADVLHLVHHLKTGSFVLALKTSTKPYVGSSNQIYEDVA